MSVNLNWKGQLQEYCHAHSISLPQYRSYKNPDDLWVATAVVGGIEVKGEPANRKVDAEHSSASGMLCMLRMEEEAKRTTTPSVCEDCHCFEHNSPDHHEAPRTTEHTTEHTRRVTPHITEHRLGNRSENRLTSQPEHRPQSEYQWHPSLLGHNLSQSLHPTPPRHDSWEHKFQPQNTQNTQNTPVSLNSVPNNASLLNSQPQQTITLPRLTMTPQELAQFIAQRAVMPEVKELIFSNNLFSPDLINHIQILIRNHPVEITTDLNYVSRDTPIMFYLSPNVNHVSSKWSHRNVSVTFPILQNRESYQAMMLLSMAMELGAESCKIVRSPFPSGFVTRVVMG